MSHPIEQPIGKVIIVTGANRGLGLAATKELLARGATVAAGVRNEASMPPLDGEVFVHELDTADGASCEQFVKAVLGRFGRIDGLINNAGIMLDPNAEVLSLSEGDLRKVLEVNLIGPLRLCQLVVPSMLARGYGRIVNVSSGLGQLADLGGGYPAYRMSKTALNALTRTLSAELGRDSDIKVNSICPGWVKTDMGGANAAREPEEAGREIADLVCLGADGPSGGFFRSGEAIAW